MSVLRKHQRQSFTVVDNTALTDTRLSWKATGLLVYLLSRPDDWTIKSSLLAAQKTDGKDSVLSAMKELETLGYLVYTKRQDSRGRWGTTTHVAESPDLLVNLADQPALEYPDSEPPERDLPGSGSPDSGKALLSSSTEDQVPKRDLLTTFVDHAAVEAEAPPEEILHGEIDVPWEDLGRQAKKTWIWDTLAALFGDPTPKQEKRWASIVWSLVDAGATPEDIPIRVAYWPAHFPNATLTVDALEKHWNALARAPLRASTASVERFEQSRRAQERETLAAELDRKALSS